MDWVLIYSVGVAHYPLIYPWNNRISGKDTLCVPDVAILVPLTKKASGKAWLHRSEDVVKAAILRTAHAVL